MTYTFKQKMKKILNIALPSGGNSLLDVGNMTISMYFIANITPDVEITKHNIVALGLSMSCWMFIFTLTTIFYVGTNAQISRAFGEKNHKKAHSVLSTMCLGALLISIPVYILANATNELFFDWMNAESTTKALGVLYLSYIFLGIPAFLTKTIFISALSATGDTKSVFFVKVIVTSLHIWLNYMLIFGADSIHLPALGIEGAGIANVIATYFECFVLFLIFCGAHRHLKFSLQLHARYLLMGLKLGIPSGIERTLTIFSLVIITKFMTDYGLEVIAGFQIGSKVEGFIFMPAFGFQVAAMSLVGQMIGAKRIDVAESFIRTILVLSCITMGILGLVLCVFGVELSSIFSEDSIVLDNAYGYILAVGLSQVPLVAIFVLDGALRGSGATKLSLWINTTSIWICRILPMWACVHFGISVAWIFAIICVETYLRSGIFGFIFYKGIWKKYIARL